MIIKDIIGKVKEYFKPVYSFTNAKTREIILTFDSIRESNVDASAEICNIPLETGFKQTEYKYPNPTTIEFTAVIQKSSVLLNKLSDYTDLVKNKEDLIAKTIQVLEEYKNYLIPVNITTKSGAYNNYTLKGYYIPENIDNYSLFEVKTQFEQIMTNVEEQQNYKNKYDTKTVNNGLAQKIKL